MEIVLPKNVAKIIMMAALISLSSCEKDVPKCDNPQVIESVFSILNQNRGNLVDEYGGHSIGTISKIYNDKITNIMTTIEDENLHSCGCEGSLVKGNKAADIIYSAQKNSSGKFIVKVDNVGTFIDVR